MHHSIKFGIIAGALFATGLFVATTPVEASYITTSNQAVYASGTYRNAGGGTSSTTILNDQNGYNQLDVGNNTAGNWAALSWTTPQDLSRVILGFTVQVPTWTISNFVFQTSTVASPSGANPGDWTTQQSFSGYPLTQSSFAFSPGITNATGLRVLATDNSTPDGKMRINEIWAFSNYHNLALTATVSAPGWTSGGAQLIDEHPGSQDYIFGQIGTNTFTWATPQRIGGMLLQGGNGSVPGTFSIQSWNGASWNTVTNVTGNTQLTQTFAFQDFVTTDQLRLLYTANGGATDALRVGEVFIFAAIPEPSTVMLFGLGGLCLWRRMRKLQSNR